MTLKAYQQTLQLATLYATSLNAKSGEEQLQQNIEVIGGKVNIWGSQVFPASPPTGMTNSTPGGFSGIDTFGVIPNYLYIEQASGTTTSIVVSGVKALPNPIA